MARYAIKKLSESPRMPDMWLTGITPAGTPTGVRFTWVDKHEYATLFGSYNLASQSLETLVNRGIDGRFDIVSVITFEEAVL